MASIKTKFRQHLRRLGRYSRYFLYLGIFLNVLLAALYGTARWYWPEILARHVDVEQLLSQATQRKVDVARVEPYWDALYPGVRISQIVLYGNDGRPNIRIAEVRASFALLPLLWRQVELHSLVVDQPSLTVARSADGRLQVVGLEKSADGSPDVLVDWLLKQRKLVVDDGELRFLDARDDAGGLTLSNLDMRLRNSGERHRFIISAAFPQDLCRACALDIDIVGDPRTAVWDGDIEVEARGLDVEKLPAIVRARLPAELRGRFDVALSSDWRNARPRALRGELAVSGLKLPLADLSRPLAVRQASADVSWRAAEDGWRLDLGHLTLALTGRPWSAGRLQVVHSQNENSVEIKHVELGDVTAFVDALKAEHPWLQRWSALAPSGTLDDLEVRIGGSLESPSELEVHAQLAGMSTTAHREFPGVRGLGGRLTFSLQGGEFELDARDFQLDLPRVFRAPLSARRAGGFLRWERSEGAWQVSGTDLRVHGADGTGVGSLRLDIPHDAAQSPVLRLRVDFKNGDGSHAARYYPVAHLKPHVLAWMESSFLGGRVTSGYLVYDGPIREFPFERGQGRFELRGHVRDATYGYLPGWMPVTNAEVDVAIDGANMLITGHGKIGTLKARDVRVEVRGAAPGAESEVSVRAKVEGPVAETVRVLQNAKPPRADWPAHARLIAAATGDGTLDLNLRLPLRNREDYRWNAEYRFSNAALKLESGAGLEAASGVLRLSDAGLESGAVRASLFGGPLALAADQDNGLLRVRANGQFRLAELLRANRVLAERVSGTVDWTGTWSSRATGPEFRAEARLAGWRTRLPAPLNRPEGGYPERVVVSTESSRADALVLALQAGNEASGKLAFAREHGRWRLASGRVELGKAAATLPRQGGLQLGLTADALDLDEWLPLLRDGGGGAELAPPVAWISADVRRFGVFGRRWGRVMAHFMRADSDWKVALDGDAVAGDGRFTLASTPAKSRVQLDLAYLRLPEKQEKQEEAKPRRADLPDPRRLPVVELRSRTLEYRDRQFGALDLRAAPYEHGWRIDRFQLTRPEMKLALKGAWRVRGEQHTSEFSADFSSDNMGATLAAWGAAEQMADGNVKLNAKLSWPGAPTAPTLAGLDGKLEFSAEKGRFLQIKQGATRLFGLLDLRSIARFMILDFSSAFGKGYAFDEVNATIVLDRGNAYTSDFVVKGPTLGLAARGRVGLVNEDYDLAIEASPKLGDALTFASWGLFGPQTAAAVFALQKLFRRQIRDSTRITYMVKGPWDSPTVTKLGRPEPPSSETTQ